LVLKFLYGRTLGQPEKVAFISMPRKDSPLPTVLSPAEVQRVLDAFLVAKYRVFFALIYATGLQIWSLWGLPLMGFFSPRSGRWPRRGECAGD
jgi:site-specific recombinase XerD